jgi:CheY-like chemotaxis protein
MVRDSGVGIEAEDLDKLFDPFVQVGDIASRYQGTGLGLAVVKEIVDRHGGAISVTSEVGVGSCFGFTLPPQSVISDDRSEAILPPAAIVDVRIEASVDRARSRKILIVDDIEANIISIEMYLNAKGLTIVTANDGMAAIAAVIEHCPDLVLMDIQLPVLNGLDAIRRIRQDLGLIDLPIIVVSAYAMADDRDRSFQAGATDYLSKPLTMKVLYDKIQSLLI